MCPALNKESKEESDCQRLVRYQVTEKGNDQSLNA